MCGKEVYYHKGRGECDFIIKEGIRATHAIQVCYNVDANNQKREINGLTEAMVKFGIKEGIIITLDQEDNIAAGNMKISLIPAWKWLIEKMKRSVNS